MGRNDNEVRGLQPERLHRKKSFSIFPSPAGMPLTKLGENNLYMTSLFPPRESFISDIPDWEGNIGKKAFFTVYSREGWPLLTVLKLRRMGTQRVQTKGVHPSLVDHSLTIEQE